MLIGLSGVASASEGFDPPQDLIDRPISSITFDGLNRVSEQEVRNNIRSAVGRPFDPRIVSADIQLLTRLGDFSFIDARAELVSDGTVALTFEVIEQPIIAEVQVVGNRLISDQDLAAALGALMRGSPRDDFLIQQSVRAIEDVYRKRGHYLTNVTVDERELDQTGILIFQVIEGPRVRVKAIEFSGNTSVRSKTLLGEIDTETAFLFLRRGELDTDALSSDVAKINQFYRDRGYLDIRVDRRIDLSPDNTEAKVTFLIEEGPQYILREVQTARLSDGKPLEVFSTKQVTALLDLRPGDVYSRSKVRQSQETLLQSYQLMGYLDVTIEPFEARTPDNQVDLLLEIEEGRQYFVGIVDIQGNFLTQHKVIRRELVFRPGRPFDGTSIAKSQENLRRTRLFGDVRITLQEPSPTSNYRDVLVQVKETNTGAVNFGVAVGSDSGALGEISLNQRNFDARDVPETWSELTRGRAFRGGGQRFNMVLRPGNELFQYGVGLTEPRVFDTDTSLGGQFNFWQRYRRQYDEERLGLTLTAARRIGEIWDVSLNTRLQRITLSDFDVTAPREVFADAGPDTLDSLGVTFRRTTVDRFDAPGKGSRLELNLEKVGLLGGDFDFAKAGFDYTVFFTLNEDFLGRRTILKINTQANYVFGGYAPTYEKNYLGGRSFRGFDFRTVSPKGIRNNDGGQSNEPIGGNWMFFLGAQYEYPIYEETMSGVFFVDSGTVTNDVGFEDYRVSIGFGIRLRIQQLGPVPIAFDFAIPVLSEELDDEEIFGFSADIPF